MIQALGDPRPLRLPEADLLEVSGVCDLKQDIGMASSIQRAVAGEISTVKLSSDIIDTESEPSRN